MNLFEQQQLNRRRTWLVMALFIGFLVLLGYGFDRFYLGMYEVPLPVASLFSLGLGSISALASYYAGDRAVLMSTGAIPLDQLQAAPLEQGDPLRLTQFDNIVEEMAIASGLPKPRVYVVPDTDPNAFATGRDPAHASIAVTQGLLELLSRDELQAVVAHEMSHIRNYDIRLATIVAALVGAVALLADWAARGMRFAGPRRDRRNGKKGGGAVVFFVIWLIAIILAPLIGRLLAMAVSRQRESLADASGAQLTRNPGALADALEKIEATSEPTHSIKQGTAHLCIADPLGRAVSSREGTLADLLASHPPMAKRIAALREMAYQNSPMLSPSGTAEIGNQ